MKKSYNVLVLIILLAIIGAVYVYPDIRFILESGRQYKGIGLTGTSEELFYLARINGIYEGSSNLSDIYCFEHQKDPWFRPFIGEFIVGNIGKMLRIDITALDILMSAILNVIIGILVFILSYRLCGSVKLGIVCSFAIMFGYNIFSANIGILKEIFVTRTYANPLWFLRPISPQFYYVPFLTALIYINRAMDIPATKKDIAIAGITLGLLFYCNVYYWTFIYAGLGISAAVYLFLKKRNVLLNIICIYVISIIISIPYLISVSKVINHPDYIYLQKNYMMFSSHKVFLYAPYIIPAAIVSGLLLIFKHRARVFIISFLAGGILCLNQQVITGKNFIQQWSFYSNKTFLIISILICAQPFLRYVTNASFKRTLFITALLFLTLVGSLQQNNYYHANKGLFLEKQNLSGAYGWFMKNNNKNEVVLTDPYQDFFNKLKNYRFLLTYTNKFSYIPDPSCMLISEEEASYRILSAFLFLGYREEDVEKCMQSLKLAYSLVDPYAMIYPPSEEYYEMIRTMYKALSRRPPADVIRKYKIDYVLIDNKDASKLGNKYNNNLTVAYKDNYYTVFNFRQQ